MIKPLNNMCLVEIIDEYAGLNTGNSDQQVQKGILRDFELISEHLTASAGYHIIGIEDYVRPKMNKLKNRIVYWEEYSDVGKKFKIDGKEYSLIPFYRLIGYEDAK